MSSNLGIAGNLNPTLRSRVPGAMLGVAGLDENRRLRQLDQTAALGLHAGFAGLDRPQKVVAIQHAVRPGSRQAVCGAAGVTQQSV